MIPDLIGEKRTADEWLAIAQAEYAACCEAAGLNGGRYDAEMAHGHEDDLREIALRAIASGDVAGPQAAALAKLALETGTLEFERWCA